jgi:hypothetical protein
MSSYESDPTCSDRSCGREESTPNRMAPVQMRMSRVQPKAVDCVRDTTTNSCLREWQAKLATACSKSSYESDSYYPNHADVCEAPTNYTEEIHGSKSRRTTTVMSTTQTTSTLETPTSTTCTDTILIQTTVMSTTLTTSTLETPTLTMPTQRAITLAPVLEAHTL